LCVLAPVTVLPAVASLLCKTFVFSVPLW
jgi:hypothetical protein